MKKVKARIPFQDLTAGTARKAGCTFVCDDERAIYLRDNSVVDILGNAEDKDEPEGKDEPEDKDESEDKDKPEGKDESESKAKTKNKAK